MIPRDSHRLAVTQGMTLDNFFSAFDRIYARSGTVHKLVIHAHGAPVYAPARILFTYDGLDAGNVRRMRHLNGKVERIKFHSCSAAYAPNGGAAFCAELARVTNANVVASQEVLHTMPRCYLRWEGTVVEFAAGTGRSRIVRELAPRTRPDCPDAAYESDTPGPMITIPRR